MGGEHGGVGRVMGIETEYGISVPGAPDANPFVLCADVVGAYAAVAPGVDAARPVRWDYAGEAPLADARGFHLERALAHPSQLTDEWVDDPTVTNVVLANGARLYVDHAHPEYSSPEVTTPREVVTWDRAGEVVMARAAAALAERGGAPVVLYKNNTDGKGAAYGTHENYLLPRAIPFSRIVAGLTPFFVARQVMCGAGRVGIGPSSEEPGFQIGARSDYLEAEVGLETTFRRPIINTRDEPHAVAERYRRLHVILGDANHADVAGLLKAGTTSLVLRLIELDAVPGDLQVADPVAELHAVSHDTGLTHLVRLVDGRRLTAVELLWAYHDLVADRLLDGGQDEATAEVMHWWEHVLTALQRDPMSAAREVDWVAKLAVLQAYRDRDRLAWDDARLRAVDIQWSDTRAGAGLARRLEDRGRLTRLIDPADVEAAVAHPPTGTRAFFRGECVRRYGPGVVAASWESVVLDPGDGSPLRWVGTAEPTRGTRDLVAGLLERCPTPRDLLRALQLPG